MNTKCHEATHTKTAIKCFQQVEVTVPGCMHTISIGCHLRGTAEEDPSLCTAKCGQVLACGHTCKATCGETCADNTKGLDMPTSKKTSSGLGSFRSRSSFGSDFGSHSRIGSAAHVSAHSASSSTNLRNNSRETDEEKANRCPKHGKCSDACSKTLPCGHTCSSKYCHYGKECPPCTQACTVKCIHSKCAGLCADPCALCLKPCVWSCKHMGACDALCGAPCTRLPCDQPCEKMLHCGHKCPSVCGEPCPSPEKVCKECAAWSRNHAAAERMLTQCVDLINMTTLREYEFESGPLIVLECGHVFAMGECLESRLTVNLFEY
jgi:hypothetical protein